MGHDSRCPERTRPDVIVETTNEDGDVVIDLEATEIKLTDEDVKTAEAIQTFMDNALDKPKGEVTLSEEHQALL